MKDDPVLILGAGLAGLSTAYHLEGHRPAVILEREDRVGGLTRSFHLDGFIFDVTGHLLHLRRDAVKQLIARLLPQGMGTVERSSFIYSKGVYTDYPFQANLHGLPPEVVRDCIVGFAEALRDGGTRTAEELAQLSFQDWGLATFGEGIARHFLFPYNRKLWCRDLNEITADWVSWSVPRPSLEEVVGGALGLTNRGLGYNPTFQYPVAGGIEVLPNALAAHLRLTDVRLRTSVTGIDPQRRVVQTASGDEWSYTDLVSTLPLPALVGLVAGAPEELRRAASGLQATQVLNVNLGIGRPDLTHRHWIYYPEDQYVFYRVGSPTSFCAASAPAGCSSLYVEVARPEIRPADVPALVRRVRRDLVRCGLLRPGDDIVAEHTVLVDPAYVIFDGHRQRYLPQILAWLEERNIRSIGRYGRWEYGAMEDALHQGMTTALDLRPRDVPASSLPPGWKNPCPTPAASR